MISLLSKATKYVFGETENCDLSDSDDENFNENKTETKEISGKISHIFDDYGLIDGKFYFPMSAVLDGCLLKIDDEITGIATRNAYSDQWTVTKVQVCHIWDDEVNDVANDNGCANVESKTDIGKVTFIQKNELQLNGHNYKIANDVDCNFEVSCGDWITATFELNDDNTYLMITSMKPLRHSRIEGEITGMRRAMGVINYQVYFELSSCKNGYYPNIGDHVHADVIESHKERLKWRATKVVPSATSSKLINLRKEGAVKQTAFGSKFNEQLLSDKMGIVLSAKLNFGCVLYQSCNKYITAWIRNTSSTSHLLLECKLQSNEAGVLSINSVGIVNESGEEKCDQSSLSSMVIDPGCSAFCNIVCSPKILGQVKQLLIVNFQGFSIARHVDVDIQDARHSTLLQSPQHNGQTKSSQALPLHNAVVIPGQRISRGRNFIPVHLPHFRVPKQLMDLVESKEDLVNHFPHLMHDLTIENYKQQMSLLLHLEELQQMADMRHFNLHRVCLRNHGEYLALYVPGLAEKRPSLLIGDRVILTSPGAGPNDVAFEGFIHQILSLDVLLKFNETFHSKYNGEDFNVQFVLNRTPMRRCHQSVHIACKLLGQEVLFPKNLCPKVPQLLLLPDKKQQIRTFSSIQHASCKNNNWKQYQTLSNGHVPQKIAAKFNAQTDNEAKFIVPNVVKGTVKRVANVAADDRTYSISWVNKTLNERQKSAVRRILAGSSRPVPYVLFGPPGTGKTVTLVEAIVQTFKLVPSSRILVCTPSNSAADLIVDRLHHTGLIQSTDMIRMNAFQRNLEAVSENVLRYCHDNVDVEVAAHKRIIASTCMAAGIFYTLGLQQGHFTHVFIDESGQATEPECLTPIGLGGGKDCQVVLAGDPLQLGPVIRSVPAKLYGLERSFLERLMQHDLYKRNIQQFADHGNFNPLLVTKLIQNYRSHHSILKFSSEQFYDNELQACASQSIVNQFCDWPELAASRFPIIFHGIIGEDSQENDSPSWFNPAEVFQCIYYLKDLLDIGVEPHQIGVITPYKKQVEKFRFMMTSLDMTDIKIGSVEEFQGQERLVIILSTVRSTAKLASFDVKHNLGFVSSPKRFNVGLTRAQALLIVVGNPHVLEKDKHWQMFLNYCLQNNAYKGCHYEPTS